MKKDKVTIVARSAEEKMRSKKGYSHAGKYKDVSHKTFKRATDTATSSSIPINTLEKARSALSQAHFTSNPFGLKSAIYKRYPHLKKRHVTLD